MMSGPAKINAFLSNIAGRRFTIANLYEAARHQPALRAAIRAAADASAPTKLLQPQQPPAAPVQPEQPQQPAPEQSPRQWSENRGTFGSGMWGESRKKKAPPTAIGGPRGSEMVNQDGTASSLTVQQKSTLPAHLSLPPHVLRAAGFALRRGLGLVALCGPSCNGPSHGRKGHPSTAAGKVPLYSGWTSSPIRRIEDLPPTTGNIGIICGIEVDVLDIDCEVGLAWAQATQPATPWRVLTGAGVRQHWYFKRRPGELHTGMVLSLGEGKSLHFRGENSLVVAPHCMHWTGRSYTPVGDWGVKLSSLPYFNVAEAEKIRGMPKQGDKWGLIRAGKAAAISAGQLPLSGVWTDAEVEALLSDAWARIQTRHRSESYRKARFAAYLHGQTPCIAGAASAEAMNILRIGLAHLLLPAPMVLDMVAASDWATKATESDGKTLWPWTRAQLADLVGRMLRSTWRDRFGYWVSAPPPPLAPESEVQP